MLWFVDLVYAQVRVCIYINTKVVNYELLKKKKVFIFEITKENQNLPSNSKHQENNVSQTYLYVAVFSEGTSACSGSSSIALGPHFISASSLRAD